jgi:hypothetical protein
MCSLVQQVDPVMLADQHRAVSEPIHLDQTLDQSHGRGTHSEDSHRDSSHRATSERISAHSEVAPISGTNVHRQIPPRPPSAGSRSVQSQGPSRSKHRRNTSDPTSAQFHDGHDSQRSSRSSSPHTSAQHSDEWDDRSVMSSQSQSRGYGREAAASVRDDEWDDTSQSRSRSKEPRGLELQGQVHSRQSSGRSDQDGSVLSTQSRDGASDPFKLYGSAEAAIAAIAEDSMSTKHSRSASPHIPASRSTSEEMASPAERCVSEPLSVSPTSPVRQPSPQQQQQEQLQQQQQQYVYSPTEEEIEQMRQSSQRASAIDNSDAQSVMSGVTSVSQKSLTTSRPSAVSAPRTSLVGPGPPAQAVTPADSASVTETVALAAYVSGGGNEALLGGGDEDECVVSLARPQSVYVDMKRLHERDSEPLSEENPMKLPGTPDSQKSATLQSYFAPHDSGADGDRTAPMHRRPSPVDQHNIEEFKRGRRSRRASGKTQL